MGAEEGCSGLRGLAKSTLMATLIASFLVFLVLASRVLWLEVLRQIGVPEYSPLPLAVLGLLVAAAGFAGLLWVYSTFNPLHMLCRTISDLPDTVRAALQLAVAPASVSPVSGCGSERIVVEGPYSCVRHPLYSSVILILIGASLAVPWLLPSLAIAVPAYYILSLAEERVLNERTCGAYSKAMRDKPLLNPLRLAFCTVKRFIGRPASSS